MMNAIVDHNILFGRVERKRYSPDFNAAVDQPSYCIFISGVKMHVSYCSLLFDELVDRGLKL